jgi:hypothetical protein
MDPNAGLIATGGDSTMPSRADRLVNHLRVLVFAYSSEFPSVIPAGGSSSPFRRIYQFRIRMSPMAQACPSVGLARGMELNQTLTRTKSFPSPQSWSRRRDRNSCAKMFAGTQLLLLLLRSLPL